MNLSDIELKIVTTVVDRFIDHNEATKRKDLINAVIVHVDFQGSAYANIGG
jgi:hypothetical protein